MKITDFSIIFGMLFLCFYVMNEIGLQVISETSRSAMVLNNVMDEVVKDALEKGLDRQQSGEVPVLLRPVILETIRKESNFLLGRRGEDPLPAFIREIILLEGDGYYSVQQGNWSKKQNFKTQEHAAKVYEISELLTHRMNETSMGNYLLQIPFSQGDANSQTLPAYGILILGEDTVTIFQGETYERYFLSGAALKERK